jgi:hypothetical protein
MAREDHTETISERDWEKGEGVAGRIEWSMVGRRTAVTGATAHVHM